ncbi:MAG: DJ-1/PfpI family protein, partial [Pseudomonadota bacterium]
MSTEIPKQSPAPLKVGMLIYPGFTLLDLAGPQAVLGMHAETYLVWKTLDPVPSDSGLTLNPTHTFAQVPDHLDVLFVPGGLTTNAQMADDEVLDFVIEAGATARYVTSV